MAEHKIYIGTRGPYYYDDTDNIDDPDGDFAGLTRHGFATQGTGYFGSAPVADDEVIRFQDIAAGLCLSVTDITTTPYTATVTDFFLLVDATVGNITLNLPAAVGSEGKEYIIKKIDATANTVIIDPDGAETIDGAATKTLSSQWQSLSVVSDGTSWYVQIGSTTLDHGSLIGLGDDDHSGYWWLNGRAGNYTAYGSTDAGGTFNLHTTSHATKGIGNLGDTLYVDEVNNRVGIGTNVPDDALTVYSGTANINQRIETQKVAGQARILLKANAGGGQIWFGDNDSDEVGEIKYNHPSDFMAFKVNGNEVMRIIASGYFGINQTTPLAQLHTNASSAATIGQIIQGAAGQTAPLLELQKSDGTIYTAFDEIGQVSGAVEQQIFFMGGF